MNKQINNDLLSDDDGPTYQEILKQKLEDSKNTIMRYGDSVNRNIIQKIRKIMTYKEDKIFTMFGAEPLEYFQMQWSFISQKLPFDFSNKVSELTSHRTKNIVRQLIQEKLTIEEQKPLNIYSYDSQQKNVKVTFLKGQSQQIKNKILQINSALQSISQQNQEIIKQNSGENKGIFSHLYSEEKKKEVQQFLRRKKKQKQERKLKLQAQKQKQQLLLIQKQKQIKQNQQKIMKEKKEQSLNRIKQLHEKRSQQKQIREQRSQQYQKLKKSLNEKPRLFQILKKNYDEKLEYQQMEKKHKMINQKKKVYQNLQCMNIEEHQKNYEEKAKQKAEQRKKRYEQYLQQQQNNYVRRHSSFELDRPVDKGIQQKQRAKEKFEKVKHYQSLIKQKHQPKVDEEKRKQMISLIQQLELNSRKKLKKSKLQNGAIVYEQIKQTDPRILGIMYLEKAKQMAARAKMGKRSQSVDADLPSTKKVQFNYLQQLRKIPKVKARKLSFIQKPDLSFDQKMTRVISQSQKLGEVVKQNQMKLKFGKFKTSQQILNCKQQIDNSYLDIAKMKLKLIKN